MSFEFGNLEYTGDLGKTGFDAGEGQKLDHRGIKERIGDGEVEAVAVFFILLFCHQ